MFSGTVFEKANTPAASLKLPRKCWALYAQIDGETPTGTIAEALELSSTETFAVVQQLQAHDLIQETVLTYAAFQEEQAEADVDAEGTSSKHEDTDAPPVEAANTLTGESTSNGTSPAVADKAAPGGGHALHIPRLWEWLQEASENQKDYKNTQAFVLIEASDALSQIGITDMEDLEAVRVCEDEDAVAALESAIEHNMGIPIPDRCYADTAS